MNQINRYIMNPPVEPVKEDCCNSGCNPCIYDVYERQLRSYQFYLEGGDKDFNSANQENALSQLEYTSFLVVKIIQLCDFHKIIFFKRKCDSNLKLWWKPGQHFLVKYVSNYSCTRAYTPIKLGQQNVEYDFAVIIKVYNEGLVSKYLYKLKLDEETLWRGPYGSYELIHNKYKRIIMIAQGTGIAPVYSIIYSILNNEDDMTKIILYYSCKNLDTILLRNELYNFNSYWNFTYKVFLSNNYELNNKKYEEPIENCRLSFKNLLDLKPFLKNEQFILCGSQQFMEEYKGLLQNCYVENIELL